MGDYMREIEYWHRTWAKNAPKCPGYGEMEGKCDGIPMEGREYCFECAVREYEDGRSKGGERGAVGSDS